MFPTITIKVVHDNRSSTAEENRGQYTPRGLQVGVAVAVIVSHT